MMEMFWEREWVPAVGTTNLRLEIKQDGIMGVRSLSITPLYVDLQTGD